MMKVLYQILLVAYVFTTVGCSEKEDNQISNEKLIATWFEKTDIESTNKYSVVEYVFDADGDYEVVRKVYNSFTGEFLGYRFQEVGRFWLNDDQLTFYVQETYVNDDSKSLYSNIEDLILSEQDVDYEFTLNVKFENNFETLVYIYPPCPSDANCLEKSVFTKS